VEVATARVCLLSATSSCAGSRPSFEHSALWPRSFGLACDRWFR
jgi:hypothetical protein